jgi:hypothetical protein
VPQNTHGAGCFFQDVLLLNQEALVVQRLEPACQNARVGSPCLTLLRRLHLVNLDFRSPDVSPTIIDTVLASEGDPKMSVRVERALHCLEREYAIRQEPIGLISFAFHPSRQVLTLGSCLGRGQLTFNSNSSYSDTLQHLYLISVLLKEGKLASENVGGVISLR